MDNGLFRCRRLPARMAGILVREAVGVEDVAAVRRLMQLMGRILQLISLQARRISASRDMSRSWKDCRKDIPFLLVALVDGEPAGCVALER